MTKSKINKIFDDTKKYLEIQQKNSWTETEYYTLLINVIECLKKFIPN